MIFSVTYKSGKPVYLQLVDQVKAASAAGTIRASRSRRSVIGV
jgi:DNA-binding transcriptional regulator YhcF (GntR family)